MTWENERRAICRAMLDAADNGTTHAVYVCWTAYDGFADADPLWESFTETADVPKWFGRDLYEELDADTLALAAAYGWNDQRVRARLHDAVRAAVEED